MKEPQLIIGMPAGSLADPNRGGNLVDLLKASGFTTKGYDRGGPTTFPLAGMFVGWDGRPQEFGAQLALDEVDIAIGGDDWIRERILEFQYEYGREITLEKALPMGRGHVRIVIIHMPLPDGEDFDGWLTKQLREKPLLTMVSEMPYLALDWFQNRIRALGFEESHAGWSVQKFKTPPKIEKGLVIYETWGKTEAKVVNGAVDFGVEITQTGSAIRNYGLVIGEAIMASQTGIWCNPALKDDPPRYELAKMLLLNIYGALFAENKVLLLFNCRTDQADQILNYLRENRLFGDEPTMNQGAAFTEFSVQMDTCNPDLPVAKVRYDLAKIGATHIETVPLDSCIPGIDAIDF
jgi:ATP phosphoribosyltransferase